VAFRKTTPGVAAQTAYLSSPFQRANKEQMRATLTTLLDKCTLDADYEIPILRH